MSEMKAGTCSDVTIKVKGNEFKMHRIYLSVVSPFFKAMFSSNFKESTSGIVELGEIKTSTFRLIYEFLLGDFCLKIPAFKKLKALICGAHQLQIVPLLDALQNTLSIESFVSIDQILEIWFLAKHLGLDKTEERLYHIFLDNLDLVQESEMLEQLEFEELGMIITDKRLNLVCEELAFTTIIKWFSANPKTRSKRVKQLLMHVKVEYDELKNWIEEEIEACNNTRIVKFLKKLLEKKRIVFGSQHVEIDREKQDLLVLLDRKDILGIDENREEVYHIARLPMEMDRHFDPAMCYFEGHIYVSGGDIFGFETDPEDPLVLDDSVVCFSNETGKWMKKGSLATPKSAHKMLVCDGKLYAVGLTYKPIEADTWGENNNMYATIDEYNPLEDKWTQVYSNYNEFNGYEDTCIMNSLVFNKTIVMFSVCPDLHNRLAIKLFDPERKKSFDVEYPKHSLSECITENSCELATDGDYIYIVTDSFRVYRFTIDVAMLDDSTGSVHIDCPVCIATPSSESCCRGKKGYGLEINMGILRIFGGVIPQTMDELVMRLHYTPAELDSKDQHDNKFQNRTVIDINLRTGEVEDTHFAFPYSVRGNHWSRMAIKRKWMVPMEIPV